MTPERFEKIKDVLCKRQTDLTVIMDNIHKPHNFNAIVRTCDAVGIQDVQYTVCCHTIASRRLYRLHPRVGYE